MPLLKTLIRCMPSNLRQQLRKYLRVTKERKESNNWLRTHCADIHGSVLSIGSEYDKDGEGGFYRDYFPAASSYTTSEVTHDFGTDLVIDVRAMPEIESESYDCIFCSGVLEHVDDFLSGLKEMTRILKPDGYLLLGLPFRQSIHMRPYDFWRSTEYGIRYLLKDQYTLHKLESVYTIRSSDFPASYWAKAQKLKRSNQPR